MFKKIFLPLFLLILVVLVFREWFTLHLIAAGDFWPYSQLTYPDNSLILHAWDPRLGGGLGGFSGPYLGIFFNVGLPITLLGTFFGLSWNLIERVYFLFPFIALTLFSISYLYKKIVSSSSMFFLMAAGMYLLNTYILMIVGGGQLIGISLSYAIFPFILAFFMDILDSVRVQVRTVFFLGVALGVQAMWDIRIVYVTLVGLGLYIVCFSSWRKLQQRGLLLTSSALTAVFINMFWILPSLVIHQNPLMQLGSAYSSPAAVKYFSFATLENSISLLHPNWPENIFGKVSFMKPEFLLLPLLAFSSVYFIGKETKEKGKRIVYFAVLALLGAFLAKGANEPFGGMYLRIFAHVPGFTLFRDSTKWYVLIAVSYCVLIPYTIEKIYRYLQSKFH